MLNIYQWFYKNIWPLKWEWVLVNYKEWKNIIHGPIWAWKSFLFFDAPRFWLYKNSQRTITNKDSKSWQVQVLFSSNDGFYLVIRETKLTNKWKDSVKTYLYSIEKNKNLIDYLENYKNEEILLKNNDILTLLNFYQIKIENITEEFKQESIIQNALDSLLPQIEVFKSTISIWQDSENIFEVENSRRISVLKSVFGIMWIDDAKEIINERRKEIYSTIKARQDKEDYQRRFDQYSEMINKSRIKLQEQIQDEELDKLSEALELDDDLELSMEGAQKIDININKLIEENKRSLEKFWKNNEKYKFLNKDKEKYIKDIEDKKLEISNIEKELLANKLEIEKEENNKNQAKAQKESIKSISEEINKISKKYKDMEWTYRDFLEKTSSVKHLDQELKNKKDYIKNTEEEILIIEKTINKNNKLEINKLLEQKNKLELENNININFEDFHFQEYKPKSIKELDKDLDKIKEKWIYYAEKTKELLEQSRQNELNLENIKNELKNKKNKINCPKCWEIIDIHSSINWNFLKNESERFEKISKQLKKEIEISEVETKKLRDYWKEKNIWQILNKIEEYWENEKKIKKISEYINIEQKSLDKISQDKWKKEVLENNIKSIRKQEQEILGKIEKIKASINPDIEAHWKEYRQKSEELNKQEEILRSIEENLKNFDKIASVQAQLKESKKKLEKEVSIKEKELEDLMENIKKTEDVITDSNSSNLEENESELTNLKESISIFNNFIDDYNKNKLVLIKLQKELELLKNLVNIFWKELVIYVFQDRIGALQDLINHFLTNVVDFKLNIQLDEKWENLDIFVEDQKWKRQVQSLSWWQKNALKIWWILWINKLNNSKMLFLDETINNFDQQSVHMISEKIKNFTEQNDLKFFMVTHSEILQQINIWTDELDLNIKKIN